MKTIHSFESDASFEGDGTTAGVSIMNDEDEEVEVEESTLIRDNNDHNHHVILLQETWGVVSQSEEETYSNDNDDYDNNDNNYKDEHEHGVLILDGEEEEDDDDDDRNSLIDLSIPGTDSLPTDIRTIMMSYENSSRHNNNNHNNNNNPNARRMVSNDSTLGDSSSSSIRSSRMVWIKPTISNIVVGVCAFFWLIAGLGFLICKWNSMGASLLQLQKERHSLETSVLELEQTIQQLQAEKKLMDVSPPWMKNNNDQDKENEGYTILDNCWIKANVKFGECASTSEISSSFEMDPFSLFEYIWNPFSSDGMMDRKRSSTTSPNNDDDDEKDNDNNRDETSNHGETKHNDDIDSMPTSSHFENVMPWTFPWLDWNWNGNDGLESVSQAIGAAGEAMISDLSQASECLLQVMQATGEGIVSEMNDLTKDPLGYVTAAVRGATHPYEESSEAITCKGLEGVAKAVSDYAASTSWAWGHENHSENGKSKQ